MPALPTACLVWQPMHLAPFNLNTAQEITNGTQTPDQIYQPINNGFYRSGFAASQSAYEQAVTKLFEALNY
jgi:glutathionyl-hydroquinone reductase